MQILEIFVVDIPRSITILIWTGGSVQHDKEIQMNITRSQAIKIMQKNKKGLGAFVAVREHRDTMSTIFFFVNGVVSVSMFNGNAVVTKY